MAIMTYKLFIWTILVICNFCFVWFFHLFSNWGCWPKLTSIIVIITWNNKSFLYLTFFFLYLKSLPLENKWKQSFWFFVFYQFYYFSLQFILNTAFDVVLKIIMSKKGCNLNTIHYFCNQIFRIPAKSVFEAGGT